jgi:renalase
VLVLDKGRGVGGRLATRVFERGRFDHGAQRYTARTPEFQVLVDEWIRSTD